MRHMLSDSAKPCSSSTSGAPSPPSTSTSNTRPEPVVILHRCANGVLFQGRRRQSSDPREPVAIASRSSRARRAILTADSKERAMLRTGKEHLETLRDGRVVYVGSERVADVTTHPAFRNAAATVAAIYDMKADPANRDTLSYEEDGGRHSIYTCARAHATICTAA